MMLVLPWCKRSAQCTHSSSTLISPWRETLLREFDDPEADLFLTTRSEHGAQPGGWTRLEGDGRVCVLTPGHNVEVWLEPNYQVLIANALRWCGGNQAT